MPTKSRTIRTGSVFQRDFKDRHGVHQKTSTWYLQYYSNGKPIRLSSGTQDYDEALAMLRNKMSRAPREHVDQPERVTMGQLFDLLIEDYEFKDRKSTYDTKVRVDANLRPFFGDRKAQEVNTTLLRQYVSKRLREKAEAATINKELSWTRRAMKIGASNEPPLVMRVPAFTMLPVDNAREGTLDHEHYRIVRDALPGYARVALVIAYHTGSRRGEITSIQQDRIDMKAQRIQLPGRTTRTDDLDTCRFMATWLPSSTWLWRPPTPNARF